MADFKATFKFFSRQPGGPENCTVEMRNGQLAIELHGSRALCERINGAYSWSPGANSHHCVIELFSGNGFHPPAILPSALEYAWEAWTNGELNEQQMRMELTELISWCDAVSNARPNSPFWDKHFDRYRAQN